MSALEFDESTHTYRVDGVQLISVTTALKTARVIDYSMIPQGVLRSAARRGTLVHRAVHYWLDGDLNEATVDPMIQGYVDAAKRFIDDTRFVPMHVEMRDWHPTHHYAGTYDLDGLMNGQDMATVDWKTGVIMDGHAAQLAAYNNFRATSPQGPPHRCSALQRWPLQGSRVPQCRAPGKHIHA